MLYSHVVCNLPNFYITQDIPINIYDLEGIHNDNVSPTDSVTTQQ